jgi:two-component system, NarL family, sensor histidine kinase BarA
MNFNSLPDKPRILVTEDDVENQKYLQLVLKREFEVEVCDSEESFNEKLSLHHFDCILMDVSLKGGKSGLQLIKEIKRKELYKNIPVVCLSAHVFSQDRNKALEAGVDAYLTKPVDNKLLVKTITNLLHAQTIAT